MAVKKVAILMTINTGEKKSSSRTARVGVPEAFPEITVPGADETYLVEVNDSQHPGPEGKPNKSAMLDSAAHELGHVLSSAFRVKGGMHEDPRTLGEFRGCTADNWDEIASMQQCRRIVSNEEHAWDIARKIRPEINEVEAERCLNSYREAELLASLKKAA